MGILNIIHKPEKIDRYKTLVKELEYQGISIDDCTLWEGIHDVYSVEAGINKAHKQIVQWAKDNNVNKITIAEDDVKFTDKGAFDYYLSKEPTEYDLYLGGIFLGKIINGVVEQFTALTLYTIHGRFYDIFLNTPEWMHLDHALAGLGKYVVCEPFIVTQHNGWSDNTKRHCNYDSIFQNRKLFKYVENV